MKKVNDLEKIRCKECGKIIETIPLCCGYDMTVNSETHKWECFMGSEQGYVSLDDLICATCCKKLASKGIVEQIC